MTFGIVPTGPETGFGYIDRGESLGSGNQVARFVEKPDLEKPKVMYLHVNTCGIQECSALRPACFLPS